MPLLDRIHSPADLKPLGIPELDELSGEIRRLLVEVVARNGGHLSSNLGTVDLTLALHKAFDAPRDQILWDIGHQAYTHKIVTGRRERIFSIRQRNGLMGFPDFRESEYDVLNAGHASTSLGVACALAAARDRRQGKENVVAVVGDGALTGGMALEALNHIGQLKPRLIIVLNDNKMSIAPNVGGISLHLNYLAAGRPYIRLKEVVQSMLRAVPGVGPSMFRTAKKIETLMRTMMVPGSLFDELGIKYIGPVNGHDIGELLREFEAAKKHDFPVLLHVATRKGEGYEPAEVDPSSYHSSAPFNIADGKFLERDEPVSYSEVFGQTVLRVVEEDPKVIALTAAMPEGTGLQRIQDRHPGRFYDVGIAEQHMFAFAAGLALGGEKPVIGVYSTFLQRAIDQVIHDLALMDLPVVVGIDRAGLVGGDGPTHQGLFDLALLRAIPGVVIAAPKDENELQHMVHSAFAWLCPVFIRYPKEPGRGVPLDPDWHDLPLGKSESLRSGQGPLVLALGPMAHDALRAAESPELGKYDLNVVNARFVSPLDGEVVLAAARAGRPVVTVEDASRTGGLGSAVDELLSDRQLSVPRLSIAVPAENVMLASRKELLAHYRLDAAGIRARLLEFLDPR